jgi:HAD superfamily hydrolase (TIGR01549 family)
VSQRWVVFDVGETLIDETRIFATWAEVLEIPQFTLMAVLGGSIATARKPEDWEHFFELLDRPDWHEHREEVERRFGGFAASDLYADALPALEALKERGYGVAITANQPAARHAQLEALGVVVDAMAMSDAMGVAKPDPAFYARTLELIGSPAASDVAYVGDRIDNDVEPAHAAGLRAVWLRRGPWAHLQRDTNGGAHLVVRSLDELVRRIEECW